MFIIFTHHTAHRLAWWKVEKVSGLKEVDGIGSDGEVILEGVARVIWALLKVTSASHVRRRDTERNLVVADMTVEGKV